MPLALNIVGGVGTTPKPPLWTDPGHTSNLTPHKEQVHPLSESKQAKKPVTCSYSSLLQQKPQ